MSSSATSTDPYHILCLERSATPEDIKSAYRQMAKRFHPDINKAPDAEEKFRLIQQAYQRISDGYRPPRPGAGQAAYKVYEIVSQHAKEALIIRSETAFPEGTVIHVMRGDQMFKIRLDERKRLPFNVTARGVVLKFRNPPEGYR